MMVEVISRKIAAVKQVILISIKELSFYGSFSGYYNVFIIS